MANNILISYDLHKPERNYDAVIAAIKALSGRWAKAHYSYWFVSTTLTASQVCDKVWAVMDANDSLFVVDAKNNVAAWQNVSKKASQYIKDNWSD